MKAVLVYQGNVAYLFQVSRFKPAPDHRIEQEIFSGSHETAVRLAREKIAQHYAVKTAICHGSNDVKMSPWKWGIKALSQSDCPIVSTRKSQYKAIGLRHKDKMLKARTAQRAPVKRQQPVVYKDYLLSPEWQAKRKEALRLAGYRCQVCYAGDVTLDVHHRTYKRLGHELITDLIVLCRPCHDIFHKHGKLAR